MEENITAWGAWKNWRQILRTHEEVHKGINDRPMWTDMPKESEKFIYFLNFHEVIYADFESIVKKILSYERNKQELHGEHKPPHPLWIWVHGGEK